MDFAVQWTGVGRWPHHKKQSFEVTEAYLQKFPDQVSTVDREVRGEAEAASKDLLVGVSHIFVEERGEACDHLEHKYPKGPPIHGLAMPLQPDDSTG
jgi:hypothetical protein